MFIKMKKLRLRVLIVLILAFSFAVCSANAQSLDSIKAAAQQEGSVTWYSVLDPSQMRNVAKHFEQKFGVHVNIIRSTSGKLIQRYSSELSAGKVVADILSISNGLYYLDGAPQDTFAAFDASSLPNMANWPDDAVIDGNTLVLSINPFVIAYNTDRLDAEDAPTKWTDLLSPELAGRMGAPNFSVSSTYVEFLDMWKNTLGDDFLKRYGEQDKRYYDSSVPGNQALAAGAYAVFAPTMPTFVKPLIDKGAPIKMVFVPTTTGNVIHAAVSAEAPHPNAALLLMNYLMSEEAQQMINKGVSATLLPDVEDSLTLPADYQAPDPQQASDRKDDLLKTIGIHG